MSGKEAVGGRLDRATTGDRLFFCSYGLFTVMSILMTSFYYGYFEGKMCMWLQIFCLGLLGAYELRNGFLKARNWPAGVVLAALTLLSLRVSLGSITRLVPMMFVYIYCARRIDFERLARFTLKWSLVTVAVVVFSAYLGIIDNVVMYKSHRVRQFLGFRYALYLPGILLNLTLLWVYLRRKTMPIFGVICWGLANWYVYYMTDSRFSFVMAEALLVLGLVMRWLPKLVEKLRPLWALCVPAFVLAGGASLALTWFYDASVTWMRRLNSGLSSRLSLGKASLEKYGVPWFGQEVEWVGNGLDSAGNSVQAPYDYVDSLYVKILQRYGIVFTVVLMVVLTWAMYRLWKKRHYLILLISAAVAAHCILDDLSFALHYNTFWIAMGLAVFAPQRLEQAPAEDPPPKDH